MRRILPVGTMLFILLCCGCGGPGVKNHSFELADGLLPRSWEPRKWKQEDRVTLFALDKEDAYKGKNSASIINFEPNHSFWLQNVAIPPGGGNYKISCMIKTRGVSEEGYGAGILVYGKTQFGGNILGSKDWQKAELYVKVNNPDVTSLGIMLSLGYYGFISQGSAWFDEVTLKKVKEIPERAVVSEINEK